jgi:hypothetical protein
VARRGVSRGRAGDPADPRSPHRRRRGASRDAHRHRREIAA